MDEVNFKAKFDDSDIERALEHVIKSVRQGEDAFKELGKEADRAMDQASKGADEMADAVKKSVSEIDDLSTSQNKAISKTRKNLKGLKVDSEKVFDSIENNAGSAGSAISRIGRLAGPVGAAIAAVAGIIAAAFLDVKENADAAKREMEGLKALGEELKNRTFAGIRAGIKFIGRDFVSASQEINKAWNGVNGTLSGVTQAGKAFFDFQNNIQKQNQQLLEVEAERGVELQKIQLLANDQNKTLKDRISLVRGAADVEQQLNNARIAQIYNEIAVLRQRNSVYGEQEGSLDKIAALQNEATRIEGQNAAASISANQQINGLIQERIKRTQELTRTLREANATLGGPAETAKAQYEAATEAIQQLREEARLLGLDLDFGPLETIAKAQFERAVDAAKGELDKLPDVVQVLTEGVTKGFDNIPEKLNASGFAARLESAFTPRFENIQAEGELAAERLGKAYAEGVTISSEPILEELRLAIQKTFDINDDQLNNLIGNLGTTYQGLTDGILANTERQITAQDRLIQAIQNRVNETTRLLQIEQQRAADGYANNVGRYEQQLEEQIKIQEEAEQKRLQLEQKAARQRLIINAAEQTSNLVLAAAKLTAAEAGKGIIGIGLALAGLATIFSIVSQAKAQAEQFKELPKFRTGTPYVDGPGTTQSDSIMARLSVGERVMSARDNAALGGRAMTNKEVIELFQLGRAFRDKMQFAAPDFSASIAKMSADRERIAQANAERQMKVMQETYRDAAYRAADKMIEYWKTRPVEWVGPNGEKMIERNEGGKIERKIIKQK